MNAQQNVFRLRRNYNRWVANETLEDYALRFTAKRARRWSAARVSNTALGAISFLALEAIGGAITLSYGFTNAFAAIMVVGAIIFLTGLPISYHAAKQGVDIDLLTRGAGFGYIGSTITSLIYASFTFIFFALEAAIMALALELTLGIPLFIGYVISSVVVIPLVTHGITLISRFQVWTQPVWVILQLLPLIVIAVQMDDALTLWTDFTGVTEAGADKADGFSLLAFGAASAVLFSLIAQIGEQVDFLRFMPHAEKPDRRWWTAMLVGGPGWIVVGVIKILIGSFLAVLALHHGIPAEEASDPNRMYLTAFGYLTSSPELTLLLVGTFVILSQLKINVTNAYAGSIAWSNFFSRLTHNHPGRVVWLVFNVAIALLLMELGIYRVLEEILSAYAIVALAWVGALVADLVINRSLGLRPREMEFKRAHLYDVNPVGVGSMLIASLLGFAAYFGGLGETLQPLASYLALGCTFITAPLLAWWTRGRYYIARSPVIFTDRSDVACCICGHHFETEDMSHCPAYAGPICSLCCSLDTRCQDMCKQGSRISEQINTFLLKLFPRRWVQSLDSRMGHFLGIYLLTSVIIAALLALVYQQILMDPGVDQAVISSALVNVFLILMIVSGVVSWMFSLVHESRQVAQEETRRQTRLLEAEIEAHEQTDRELQHAKEQADSANQAKSRYLTGISHELRSPLNAILGYAQLLEKDRNIPENRREALQVIRRSSEHLSDLIEGLLDISRIEAGRLELALGEVNLPNLLEQIVGMFRVQAQSKGLDLHFSKLSPIPELVRTDEKRLRQILINLLSNAVKYTREGRIDFTVRYRNQVAEFCVRDTGAGIPSEELERIFRPFERLTDSHGPQVPGTGLGLTITRLLTDIMGGELGVSSQPGSGSEFRVSLMLSPVAGREAAIEERTVWGYEGPEKTLIVVDDEPTHRGLLQDTLQPLGFKVIQASDGPTCLDMLRYATPDIFLLDISMPGMDGWSLASAIRKQIPETCIIMVSADAHQSMPPSLTVAPHNAYLVKPIQLQGLLDALAVHAGVVWQGAPTATLLQAAVQPGKLWLPDPIRHEIRQLAQIGYATGLLNRMETLKGHAAVSEATLQRMTELVKKFQFGQLLKELEKPE